LLIPEGSRLLELDEVRRGVGAFDAESLAYPWRNPEARMDTLSEIVQRIAADADREKESRSIAFARIWRAAHAAAGIAELPLSLAQRSGVKVPFLSEPWYCCAEPTKEQLVSIGSVAKKAAQPATVAAEGFV
jgi:hypothetical protein